MMWARRITGSMLEPKRGCSLKLGGALLFSFAWLLLFLPAGNPWIGVLVDEPFTLVGAARVARGEVPYRDFFFLWTPGILYLHAVVHAFTQEWLFSGRVLIVLAGLFLLVRHHQAAISADISGAGRALVWGLGLVWCLTPWNQPYSSWYAILLLLFSARLLGRHNLWAGVLVALVFWFKQNIGLYGLFAALAYLLLRENKKSVFRFVGGWVCGLLPGLVYFWGHHALGAFLSQTLAFPWVYRRVMAHPLSEVSFADPVLGAFFILTLVALPGSLFVYWRRRAAISSDWEKYLFMAWVGFLQIYPRYDFTHFIFSFSSILVPLVWAVDRGAGLRRRVGLGALFLLLIAGFWRSTEMLADTWGGTPVYGLRSRGFIHDYLTEIQNVTAFLHERGLREGDMVLQIPVTTAFYLYSGLKNGTPHDQFFPQYVEGFGARQDTVLKRYLERGGHYVVLDRHAKAKEYTPELMRVLERDFHEVRGFPLTLSVWEPRSMLRK